MTTDVNDEEIIRQVVHRLAERFPDAPHEEVERVVKSEFDSLAGRPIRDYLSTLVERAAKKRLKKSAQPA